MARSVLGSSLQQVYILLIAPQWLAVTVLLLGGSGILGMVETTLD